MHFHFRKQIRPEKVSPRKLKSFLVAQPAGKQKCKKRHDGRENESAEKWCDAWENESAEQQNNDMTPRKMKVQEKRWFSQAWENKS